MLPIAGTQWPPHVAVSAATQSQIQPQPQPNMGSSNLVKMTQLARSTPQLDDNADSRDRDRSRERPPHLHNTRDSLISQVRFPLFTLKNKLAV